VRSYNDGGLYEVKQENQARGTDRSERWVEDEASSLARPTRKSPSQDIRDEISTVPPHPIVLTGKTPRYDPTPNPTLIIHFLTLTSALKMEVVCSSETMSYGRRQNGSA
jgi:hypothetical protein